MSKAKVGNKAPDFKLPATGGKDVKLSDLKGQHVVIYFYPKDNTPGCTKEGQGFNDAYQKFKRRNTVILGISRDSAASHDKFKDKYGFKFDLLADQEEAACTLYDVIKMKNMYGKQVRGIERSTFLVDKEGVLRREWRKVKVNDHVEEVLEAINEL